MATFAPIARAESSAEERSRAAVEIQRHYRGHRERRHLKGHQLTPTQRWNEALKEAHYRQVARPVPVSCDARPPAQLLPVEESDGRPEGSGKRRVSQSKEKWDKAVLFAKQAQHDDELSSDSDSGNEDGENSQAREERREERRQKRLQKRRERIEYSKAMDMQYELSFPC
ncbi:hypothetical protein DFP73DRAFT_262861 [Morchella snyderi]|nr:hypothetical protein DFP73DRAFT_262861 [Morchella snyderi]